MYQLTDILGHDVEREYIRQTLGSVAIALMDKHQG